MQGFELGAKPEIGAVLTYEDGPMKGVHTTYTGQDRILVEVTTPGIHFGFKAFYVRSGFKLYKEGQ